MYNRYIPQSDGSFLKTKLPEQCSQNGESIPSPVPVWSSLKEDRDPEPAGNSLGIRTFLRNLIPGGLDVEDLIVILLLLLVSQDGGKNGNRALLTLGAYLFLG